MGIYLNPDNIIFKQIANKDIYVDKSMLLSVTNKLIENGDKYVCMSRPRRFGKTIAQNMIAAYYSRGCDSKGLFDSLKIANEESYGKYLNRYNVIQIDLNSEYQNIRDKSNVISSLQDKIIAELRKAYSDVAVNDYDSLAEVILKIYSATSDTFIILIDEYDVLVREQVAKSLFDEFLSFLNGLFKSSTLRPAISLAYLTGIMPVVRDKIQSKLNNFEEYTILDADGFAEYMGFTSDEVLNLCKEYNMDFDECRNWYDGYNVNGFELYSPESVVKSMKKGKYGSYWGKTSSYQVISDRIAHNYKGLKDDIVRMLSGEEIPVNITSFLNTMSDFNTKDDMYTYLIHLGYLAYNGENETCHIPNREVRQEWFNAIAVSEGYETTDEIINNSKELLDATLNGDEEQVSKALDVSHIHVASNRNYNNEDVFQSAIYLAYIYALNKYTVIKEMTTGKGFADVVYIPLDKSMPAMIIELKHNKTAETALNQIKDKQYFDSLAHYKGNLLFVGISYDEKEKTHSCRIEKYVKEE